MRKKKCPDCQECLPAWLAAFGDLMSLMLCFFVLLLSMSSFDTKKITEAVGSLTGAMSVLEGGPITEISKNRIQDSIAIEARDEISETVTRVEQAAGDANEMMEQTQGRTITVEEAQEGFVIELPAALLFKPGSATIENQDALLFLKRIALIIEELPNEMKVSVKGHTDEVNPSASSLFKDNWELSTARAISVLHELLLDGVEPSRVHAEGYAEFRPVATNITKSGREKNRRVELHFYGMKKDKDVKIDLSILDTVSSK